MPIQQLKQWQNLLAVVGTGVGAGVGGLVTAPGPKLGCCVGVDIGWNDGLSVVIGAGTAVKSPKVSSSPGVSCNLGGRVTVPLPCAFVNRDTIKRTTVTTRKALEKKICDIICSSVCLVPFKCRWQMWLPCQEQSLDNRVYWLLYWCAFPGHSRYRCVLFLKNSKVVSSTQL